MNKKNYVCLGLALLLLILPLAPAAAAAPVADGVIGQAADVQLIPGSLAAKAPTDNITRGEFLELVSRLNEKLGADSGGAQQDNPQGTITLQEASVLLVDAIDAGFPHADVTLYSQTVFDDNWQIAGEAKAAVNYLYHHRIIGVPGVYMIHPRKELTVQQAVEMVYRIYLAGDKFNIKTTIPDEWEWAIDPVYDGLGPNTKFSGGLAAVSHNGQYGYIDRYGQVVIPFQYDMAYDFSEGLSKVVKNGRTGYISKQGETVIPLEYEDGGDFSEGRVWLKREGKYGFADPSGTELIPLQYDYAYDFREGLAPVKKEGRYGYIDFAGNTVIPFQYDWAASFSEGLARTGSRSEYNYIDKAGEVALALGYDYLFDFKDGRAIVFNRDQYGVIDKTGQFQIGFGKFGLIYGFNNGLSVAHGNSGYEGNHSYINPAGETVIGGEPFYDAEDFSEGLAAVASHNKITDKGTRSYVTRMGELILPRRANIKAESIHDDNAFYLQAFSEGLAAVVTGEGKLGFIENPLLKRPIEGEGILEGPVQVKAGSDYTLTYSLRGAKNISAQQIKLTYDQDVLELQGSPDMMSELARLVRTKEIAPGEVNYLLAIPGHEHQMTGDVEIMQFHFKVKKQAASAYVASVSAVLADGQGNEAATGPVWNPPIAAIPVSVPVTSIAVTGEAGAASINVRGGTLQLYAEVSPANADNPTVTWAVYNEDGTATDKAEISIGGLVTANKDGTVKAVATAADGSGASGSLMIAISGQSGSTPVGSGGGSPSDTISHELGTVKLADNSATLTISADKLDALAKKSGETVKIDFSGSGRKSQIVDIAAASLSALSTSGKSLEVNTGAAAIILPPNALKLDGATGAVKIGISRNGQSAVSQNGLVSLTEAVSVTIADGAKNLDLQKPVGIALNLQADGKDLQKAGIYALDAKSGTWEYVGGIARGNRLILQTSNIADTVYAAFIYNKSFLDVATGHWAKDYVEVMASRHVVDGIDGARFAPSGTVTRAEFAAMAVRMLQLPAAPGSALFPDVAKGAWYADEIAAAAQAGILQGDGTGVRPEDPISRQEMAMMAVRMLKSYGINPTAAGAAYADQPEIADWARDAVGAAQSLGIMDGRPGNVFKPRDFASRAEAAAVFYRLIDKSGQM